MSRPPAVVTILGAGPRGLGILDRLGSALIHQRLNRPVEIHVVDPYEAGSGRVWRTDQSPLMLANSKACEITLFSDETVRNAGVPRYGPSMQEWAALHASGLDAELAAEAAAVGPETFVSRRLLGAYLRWCFASVAAALAPTASLVVHQTSATRIRATETADEVVLADGRRIRSDVVVLALGNRDGAPPVTSEGTSTNVLRLEPQYTADINLEVLPAGQNVRVEGLGLAFIDLMTLVTEGRGGRFEPIQGGRLTYHASGTEPILNATSPRGVPYLPKPAAARTVDPKEPLIATRAAWISALTKFGSHPDESTRSQAAQAAWGLLHAEMAAGWYGELLGDPQLAADMLRRLPGTAAWDDKRTAAIAFDRELAPFRAPPRHPAGPGSQPIKLWARKYLLWALDLVGGQLGHAHAGAYRGLVHAGMAMGEVFLDGSVQFTPAMAPLMEAMASYIRYVTSGPPTARMEQLLALVEAGLVRLLGPSSQLANDAAPGYFIAARLPTPDVRSGPDALLRGLVEAGKALATGPLTSEIPVRVRVEAGTFRLLTPDPAVGGRRFAVGAFATSGALVAFPRPCANSRFFAENAAIASQIVEAIGDNKLGGSMCITDSARTVGAVSSDNVDSDIRLSTGETSAGTVVEFLRECIQRIDQGLALDPDQQRFVRAGVAELSVDARTRWAQWDLVHPHGDRSRLYGGLAELARNEIVNKRVVNFFYMHKPPGIRLRFEFEHQAFGEERQLLQDSLTSLIGRLSSTGISIECRPSFYEPEAHLFGGASSMRHVHALFTVDSLAWLEYLATVEASEPAWAFSLGLLRGLLDGLQVVGWEDLDVWERVRRQTHRKLPASVLAGSSFTAAAAGIRSIWKSGSTSAQRSRGITGLAVDEIKDAAADWLAGYFHTAEAYVGPREAAAFFSIFHWNRGRLPVWQQSLITEALVDRGAL